jgi:hypothetical protein
MILDPVNSGMSHVAPEIAGDLPLRTLDGFAFEQVDFLKIDAEGFESAVLRGALDTLARCRPLILLEEIDRNAKRYGEASESARQLLLDSGARLVAELPDSNYLYQWPGPNAAGD